MFNMSSHCPVISSNLFKVSKNVQVKTIKSKMNYSESESDFSFAINSASDFDSTSETGSESESESDFSSVFMNLDIWIFSPCI